MIPFDLAISLLNKSTNPVEDILESSAYYLPLQMLYCELLKNKDIVPLSEISDDQKSKYWSLVVDKDKPKYVKIWMAQAIYCFEKVSSL